jgi:putative transposase
MPRGPRIDGPGILHHVMARGIERREIFRSDGDREELLSRLGTICEDTGTVVYAWCLMPNHFHLAVRTGAKPLAHTMRRLLTGYAAFFNRRYGRVGHLFQNRYKSIVVDEERYFLGLVRYIHLNPVRASIVPSIDALADCSWTGHAVLLGKEKRPWQEADEVLGRFGEKTGAARRELVAFMGSSEAKSEARSFRGGGLRRSVGAQLETPRRKRAEKWAYDERVLGSGRFVEAVLKLHEGDRSVRVTRGEQPWAELDALVRSVSARCGVAEIELRNGSRRREVCRARHALSSLASRGLGISAAAIARELNVSAQSVLKSIEKGAAVCAESKWSIEELL